MSLLTVAGVLGSAALIVAYFSSQRLGSRFSGDQSGAALSPRAR